MSPFQSLVQSSPPLLFLIPQQRILLGSILAMRASVKNVVLGKKDAVVHHAHIPQGKFYRIACDATPVALQVTVDALLPRAQSTTRKVKRNLPDTPSLGALVAVVG